MYEPQIIKVTVYELEGIELGFNATEKIGNTLTEQWSLF